MGERQEDVPKVEKRCVGDFVLTDAEVETLAGGMVRILFFCQQRPLDTSAGTEQALQACAVTTEEIWRAVARKIDFALACREPPRCRGAAN